MRSFAFPSDSTSNLRTVKKAPNDFPVYPNLLEDLHALPAVPVPPPGPAADVPTPDQVAQHLCAVLSGWSYSDAGTLSDIVGRMGLEHYLTGYEVVNNGLLIHANSYLLQSKRGGVALLVYRGTDPFDLSTWAIDNDVNPEILDISKSIPEDARVTTPPVVHGGFYRNQRSTWYKTIADLQKALNGQRIDLDAKAPDNKPGTAPRLQKLFITGHSLGAAMATLAAFRLKNDGDPTYKAIGQLLSRVYLFAPPMVGNEGFAQLYAHAKLDEITYCYRYNNDIVPCLPPVGITKFAHVGQHFHSELTARDAKATESSNREWRPSDKPAAARAVDLVRAVVPLFTSQVTPEVFARDVHVPDVLLKLIEHFIPRKPSYSFADHIPTNYIVTSQPDNVLSEFGNDV